MPLQGDIFKSSADGSLITFEQAFPTIAAITVDIDEQGEGNQGLGRRRLTRRSVREFINCSNPACGGRGLDLGTILRQMVEVRRTTMTFTRACESHDEAGHPCQNAFHLFISLAYK